MSAPGPKQPSRPETQPASAPSAERSAEPPSAKPPSTKPTDLVLIHGVTEDRTGYGVLRLRPDRIEAGVLRPLEHGRPITGEIVRLRPRPEAPVLFDVEVQDTPPRSGPPQVATETYRRGWDAIWGSGDPADGLPDTDHVN